MARAGTIRRLVLAAALVVAVAACGSGDDGKDAASSQPTTGDAVTIKGFAFNPDDLQVKAGTKVTWTNRDSSSHTATADDGAFNTKTIAKGGTATVTLSTAGTFAYHCDIHPTMHGSTVVT